MAAVQKYVIQQGAFNWQLFYNSATLQGPPFAQGNTASCTKWFRETACVENSTLQHVPLLYGIERNHDYPPFKYIVSFEQSLAAFLLARGPFAWFGYSCACDDLPSSAASLAPSDLTRSVVACRAQLYRRLWARWPTPAAAELHVPTRAQG